MLREAEHGGLERAFTTSGMVRRKITPKPFRSTRQPMMHERIGPKVLAGTSIWWRSHHPPQHDALERRRQAAATIIGLVALVVAKASEKSSMATSSTLVTARA